MNIRELTSWIASICSIALWLTGVPACKKIYHQGNTSNVAFFPFLCMFCGSTLWMKYGLLKNDPTLYYVNGAGSVINFVFIIVYYVYTYQKSLIHKQLIGGCLLLFPILVYIKYHADTHDAALKTLGLYCAFLSVLSYGSPLAGLSDVCKTRSTECLSFSLSLANVIVAIEWWMYGILLSDLYVKIPNLLGTILGLLQLTLFCVYPAKKSTPPSKESVVLNA